MVRLTLYTYRRRTVRKLVSLRLGGRVRWLTEIHNVISTDSTIVDHNVPGPECNSVPLGGTKRRPYVSPEPIAPIDASPRQATVGRRDIPS